VQDDKFFRESYVSTIGAEFGSKSVNFSGDVIKFQVWDTAGQERYQSITRSYYRGADGVLLCFDITNENSFKSLDNWLSEIEKNTKLGNEHQTQIIIVGTKSDLNERRVVSYTRAKKFADARNLHYIEISSATGQNVMDSFYVLARDICLKFVLSLVNLEIDTKFFFNSNYGFELNISQHSHYVPPKNIHFDGDSDSDDECFSDEELEEEINHLVEKGLKTGRNKKLGDAKHARTNVNICTLTMANLAEEKEGLTGDPVFCKNCGVLFNSKSKLSKAKPKKRGANLVAAPPIHPALEEFAEQEQPKKSEDGASYWACEFCMEANIVDIEPEEIPKTLCYDYTLVPAPTVDDSENYSNIVFCVDVSGSMCVTSELPSKLNLKGLQKREERVRKIRQQQEEDIGDQYLPGQKRGGTFVSRLQCVQSAVDHQISKYIREHPEYRVGLVSFSSEVSLIGDGTQEQKVVNGDRLYSWDELQEIGNNFKIETSIAESSEALLEKLWDLEESGPTALGPALQLSIAIAGSKAGSHVILCTDGLANVGLGSLEGKEAEYTPYYIELAEQAKLRGVTVSVISLIGTECCLENLSIVTEQTGGIVTRVDPLQLENELATLNNQPILGYTTMAMVILHHSIRFQNEMDDEQENRNWLVKDLGNVRADTEFSFQYCFRSKEECDLSEVKEIPFQVQLMYTKPCGAQCLRVANATIAVTSDRNEAEQHANIEVIGTHAAQRAALLARGGDYERAQMETRSAQRFMARNGVKKERISNWSKQVQDVDNVVKRKRKNTNTRNPTTLQFDDSSVTAMSKQKTMKFW